MNRRYEITDEEWERLAPLMSPEELSALLDRFRAHLAEAIEALAESASVPARAHRVAGIAGMLGFADVHRHWLALSEAGDSADAEDARIAARRAILQLDRRSHAAHTGS